MCEGLNKRCLFEGKFEDKCKGTCLFYFKDVGSLYRMDGGYRAFSNPVFLADLYFDQ